MKKAKIEVSRAKARDEKTSPEVASLAGRIMDWTPPDRDRGVFFIGGSRQTKTFEVSGRQLKAMAASLLNQATDKPKAKPKRRVKP